MVGVGEERSSRLDFVNLEESWLKNAVILSVPLPTFWLVPGTSCPLESFPFGISGRM